ncbi:MAG: methyltransferase domain-containing protein [Desulfobacterota bacterium]|jgi:SAM-dependent methyltransferase|nr:methyltransferase domain-containing protein [Thermodesulfobacteriota bacterium]
MTTSSPWAASIPDPLLVTFAPLLLAEGLQGPVLDLACGDGHNGLYLAGLGVPVILADRSGEALDRARKAAAGKGLPVTFLEVDLETGGNPLEVEGYRAILVFRYLHRPLVPCIRKGIRQGGFLIYETFTSRQTRYGRPRNPDFLLQPGELADWFKDWQLLHSFEGLLEEPLRAVAQIVCRKPV